MSSLVMEKFCHPPQPIFVEHQDQQLQQAMSAMNVLHFEPMETEKEHLDFSWNGGTSNALEE